MCIRDRASAVAGELGGQVGVSPRVFLKKLVAGVLDVVELHDDFDPRMHYKLTVSDADLTPAEQNARRGISADDIELDV